MLKHTGEVDAYPTKDFFIDMLTRDIGIPECILDLIDNAIDKAVREADVDVTEILLRGSLAKRIRNRRIDIDVTPSRFRVRDNCGGISKEEARKEIFLFGHSGADEEPKRLSVYGIGMKRAFFKLGRHTVLHSRTTATDYAVEVDVDSWRRTDDWSFDFASEAFLRKLSDLAPKSTEITITKLSEAASKRFRTATFETELRRRLSRAYALYIKAGIVISLNEAEVEPYLPELAGGKAVTSVRQEFAFDGVDVLLMAGVTPAEDRTPHGWYVFCNGRMVVEADKTELTGWGASFPQFHTKYNHFLGYAYFSSEDVTALPWTTTKQGIDRESPVYQQALSEMRIQARPVLSFLSDLYPTDIEPSVLLEREVIQKATRVPLDKVPRKQSVFSVRKPPRKVDNTVPIRYRRAREDVDRIRKHLGDRGLSSHEIGEFTFDHFLREEVD